MRVIHSSEIADDPAAFEGDYVPLEDVEVAIAHKLAALSSPSLAESDIQQKIDTSIIPVVEATPTAKKER